MSARARTTGEVAIRPVNAASHASARASAIPMAAPPGPRGWPLLGNLLNFTRRQAIRTLAEIVNDTLPDGDNRDFTVKIANEAGVPIFEALMSFRSGWIGEAR